MGELSKAGVVPLGCLDECKYLEHSVRLEGSNR